MGCGAVEATCVGFVCFVVPNPCVLLANRVDFGRLFCFINCQFHLPPPQARRNLTKSATVTTSKAAWADETVSIKKARASKTATQVGRRAFLSYYDIHIAGEACRKLCA